MIQPSASHRFSQRKRCAGLLRNDGVGFYEL